MTGLIVAMEAEAREILKHISDAEVFPGGMIKFYTGTLYGERVALAVCGIGKVSAAYATTLMTERYHPDRIISTGIAGGLGVLKTLDVLIADAVVQHDMDTSPLGDPKGFISGINVIEIKTSESLSHLLKDAVPGAVSGTVATGDSFIADTKKAAVIRTAFSASACDMESAAVGQVAYMTATPFAVLRVISDSGEDGGEMTYNELIRAAAETNSRALIRTIEKISEHKGRI